MKLIMEGWRDYLANLGNQDLADATPIKSDAYRQHTNPKSPKSCSVVVQLSHGGDRDFKAAPLRSFEINILGRDDDCGLNARAGFVALFNDAFAGQNFTNASEAVKQINAQDPGVFDLMDEQSQDGADERAKLLQQTFEAGEESIHDMRPRRKTTQKRPLLSPGSLPPSR